jgi:hypothetical protein
MLLQYGESVHVCFTFRLFHNMQMRRLDSITLSPCDIFFFFSFAASCHPVSRRIATQLKIGSQQLGEFDMLAFDSTIRSKRNVALVDYSNYPSLIPFTTAWDWQKHLLEGHVERMTPFLFHSIID